MGIINKILSTLNTLWALVQAIPTAINALEWQVVGWINSVINDIDAAYQYSYSLAEEDINYAVGLFNALDVWATNLYNGVITWASDELTSLWNWVQSFYAAFKIAVSDLYSYIDGTINAFLQYIYQQYIAPLINGLAYALSWLSTYGSYILNLLTHPDQLAEFVGRYILGAWMSLGRKFALPFFKWFYSSAISLVPDFTDMFEELISSMFD
jgi:hypothetical protein